jgi:hypothetical protein
VTFILRLRGLLVCGLVVAVGAIAQPQQSPAVNSDSAKIVLRDGTPLRLTLAAPLSSKAARAGDPVSFRIADPVLVDGLVVIPRGAAVVGKVTQSRKPGAMGRPGELTVSVDRLFLSDSTSVPLRGQPQTTKGVQGIVQYPSGQKGFDNLLVLPAFLVVSFLEAGSQAAAPMGTIVTGYVDGDLTLDRESVRQLQVADATAHVFIYFPGDRLTRFLCADCSKSKKAGDPGSAPRLTKPVFLGSIEITRLTFESYARVDLPPGSYWVHSSGSKDFQADLSAAKSYYLRMTQSGFGKGNLEVVSAERAASEMSATIREMIVHVPADDSHLHDTPHSMKPSDDTETE